MVSIGMQIVHTGFHHATAARGSIGAHDAAILLGITWRIAPSKLGSDKRLWARRGARLGKDPISSHAVELRIGANSDVVLVDPSDRCRRRGEPPWRHPAPAQTWSRSVVLAMPPTLISPADI